jgi:hypothetical protein
MSKNRQYFPLVMLIAFVAIVSLVGRSPAHHEIERRADAPLFVKIGKWRFNPSQVTAVNFNDFGDGILSVFLGAQHGKDFKFGTNGEAEALLEWFDRSTIEIKPLPPKKSH